MYSLFALLFKRSYWQVVLGKHSWVQMQMQMTIHMVPRQARLLKSSKLLPDLRAQLLFELSAEEIIPTRRAGAIREFSAVVYQARNLCWR